MLYKLMSECSDYDFKVLLEEKKPKSWLKTVSAFANTIGGSLFFGIDDNKRVLGIDNYQYVSDKISELINQRIKPVPNYTLIPINEEEKIVIVVRVNPGCATPYYYNSDGIKEAYIRSGNESIVAPAHILNELILKGTSKTYDTIVTQYKKTDYSFAFFEATFLDKTLTKINESDYRSFSLVDDKGYLTNAGVLLADQDIYRHNRIFCTCWNGLSKSSLDDEAVDDKEYNGCIIKLLFSALDFIKANTKKRWRKEATVRIDMPDYDELACREAIVNGLIHRQYTRVGSEVCIDIYTNRIEITSPGSMFSGKTIEKEINDVVESERRNPVLADIFARMRFMDRRGSGLKKIMERTNALFNDDKNHVDFYCKDDFFKVIIYNANYKKNKKADAKSIGKKMTAKTIERKEKILSYLYLNGEAKSIDIANEVGLGISRIKLLLNEMVQEGKIKIDGGNRDRIYSINDKKKWR